MFCFVELISDNIFYNFIRQRCWFWFCFIELISDNFFIRQRVGPSNHAECSLIAISGCLRALFKKIIFQNTKHTTLPRPPSPWHDEVTRRPATTTSPTTRRTWAVQRSLHHCPQSKTCFAFTQCDDILQATNNKVC